MRVARVAFMLMAVGAVLATAGCEKTKTVIDPDPTDQTGDIEGTVTETGNTPVSGASVSTIPSSATTTTDGAGHYRLTGLTAGDYTIQATAAGFTIDAASAHVSAGQSIQVRQTAHRQVPDNQPGIITGVILNQVAGTPITGAAVSTLPATSTVYTGADGGYSIPNVPAGRYRLVAIAPSYAIDTVDVAVTAGQTTMSRQSATRLEAEGNDTFMQANPLLLPDAVDGWVGSNGDEQDWFSIVPARNGRLSLRIENRMPRSTASAALGKVSVLMSDQVELTHQYGGSTTAGTTETTSPVPVVAGHTYYLLVARSGLSVAHYRLSLFFEPEQTVDSDEPNNDRSHAGAADENSSLVGLIGYGDDSEDWYVVKPNSAGTLTVHVYNLQPSGVVHGAIGKVEILDGTLRSLAHNYGSSTGAATNESLSTAVGRGATYYVHVVRLGNLDAAPYRLEVARN